MPYWQYVWDVIHSIENDMLLVFDPEDEDALTQETNAKGEWLVNKRTTMRISIREWLCVGVQLIGEVAGDPEATRKDKENVLAYYRHNASTCLYPPDGSTPPGPVAFSGQIRLWPEAFPKDNSAKSLDSFRFIIAHELVHVFDAMRLLVPAVMNWRKVWTSILGQGTRCDLASSHYEANTGFLDAYATENELRSVAAYWPSRAKKWFNAVRRA